jgi:hypothetical protein
MPPDSREEDLTAGAAATDGPIRGWIPVKIRGWVRGQLEVRLPLILLNLGAIVLFGFFLHGELGEWGGDNVHYLLLARAIATGKGYVCLHLPGTPPHTYYPPLYPLLLAPLVAVGLPLICLKIWTALLALAGLNGAYFYLSEYHDRWTAWLVTAATLCCGAFLAPSLSAMSEGPYLLFSMAALYAARRYITGSGTGWKEGIGAGILLSMAMLTRLIGLALAPALLCTALLGKWRSASVATIGAAFRRLLLIGGTAAIIAAPWIVRQALVPGKRERSYFRELIFGQRIGKEKSPVVSGNLASRPFRNFRGYWKQLAHTSMPRSFQNLGPKEVSWSARAFLLLCLLILLLVIIGFLGALLQRRGLHDFYVLFYLLTLFVWVGGSLRLFMPILPFLFVYTYEGISALSALTRKMGLSGTPPAENRRVRRIGLACLVLLLLSNIAVTLFFPVINDRLTGRYKQWWREYLASLDFLKDRVRPGEIITSRFVHVAYYRHGIRGVRLRRTEADRQAILNTLLASKATFLIMLKPWRPYERNFLLPAIEHYPDHFRELARFGDTRVIRIIRN